MTEAPTQPLLDTEALRASIRLAQGLLPLVASRRSGVATPSVKVTGLMLDHFPDLAEQWRRAGNLEDPTIVPAGSSLKRDWTCPKGHTWPARIANRTVRQTRCRYCYRQWATPETSVLAVRPDLGNEWDVVANGRRSPARIKATSRDPMIWGCLDDPEHPPYRMSSRARTGRLGPACPLCRKKAWRTNRSRSRLEAEAA